MPDHGEAPTRFGCERCWPDNAELVWRARGGLAHGTPIVDDMHFIVAMLACEDCQQQFLSIMTETIDWDDGETAPSSVAPMARALACRATTWSRQSISRAIMLPLPAVAMAVVGEGYAMDRGFAQLGCA